MDQPTPTQRPAADRATAGAREQLAVYGADALSDEELLALLLSDHARRPAREQARAILEGQGGLAALASASPAELAALPGLGPVTAARVAAAFILATRATRSRHARAVVSGPEDVHARLAPRLAALQQEVFVVLALDVRNAVIAELEIARGTLSGVEVHPREVLRPLIRRGAAACVLAHNHPSGDPSPSQDDLALTDRLRAAGELVGIPVLDHVVIAAGGFRSLMR